MFQVGKEGSEKIRTVLMHSAIKAQHATSLGSSCLMSAGSSLPAAVSSHLFLIVSHLFPLCLFSYFSLCVCRSDTDCWWTAYLSLSRSLPLSLSQSYLMPVTEAMCKSAYSSLISYLPNSTALSLSLFSFSLQVQSLVSHRNCKPLNMN